MTSGEKAVLKHDGEEQQLMKTSSEGRDADLCGTWLLCVSAGRLKSRSAASTHAERNAELSKRGGLGGKNVWVPRRGVLKAPGRECKVSGRTRGDSEFDGVGTTSFSLCPSLFVDLETVLAPVLFTSSRTDCIGAPRLNFSSLGATSGGCESFRMWKLDLFLSGGPVLTLDSGSNTETETSKHPMVQTTLTVGVFQKVSPDVQDENILFWFTASGVRL